MEVATMTESSSQVLQPIVMKYQTFMPFDPNSSIRTWRQAKRRTDRQTDRPTETEEEAMNEIMPFKTTTATSVNTLMYAEDVFDMAIAV